MRKWLILAGLAVFGAYMSASIFGWWAQPIAAFLGRRELWADAQDFAVFYAAGTLVSAGNTAGLYDPIAHAPIQLPLLVGHTEPFPYFNPPLFSLLFVPLSWLSAEDAFRAWTIASVLLIGVVSVLLWRIAQPLEPVYRVVVIVGFLSMYPLSYGLWLGQFSLILVASWAAAFILLRDGRDRAAGFALAPLLIKPELLIPVTLFLVWKRRWDALKTLVPVSAAAVLLSIAMIGPVGAWDYATHIAAAAGDGSGSMYGLNGLLASLFAANDPGSMTLAATPLALIAFAGTAFLWRGEMQPASSTFPTQWLALTLATLLWDAHLYLQDVILVVPAAVAVLVAATAWRRTAVGAAIVGGWFILGYGHIPSTQWGINVFTAYMAGCLMWLVGWNVAAFLSSARTVEQEAPAQLLAFDRRAA